MCLFMNGSLRAQPQRKALFSKCNFKRHPMIIKHNKIVIKPSSVIFTMGNSDNKRLSNWIDANNDRLSLVLTN